ncbi:methionine biosynthesis protein MetW [bacterium]|nr:methionine biosynthesis protein MetW [bacterium]
MRPSTEIAPATRWDHELTDTLVRDGARVLDLGCGDGTLLARLGRRKVSGQGVEINAKMARQCVDRGVPVIQADLDEGLLDYFADDSFDYVILEKTLQTVNRPERVVNEMLRIGSVGIVSFPNFGHRAILEHLTREGRMPVNPALPYEWYETPNIRHLTILDFEDFCAKNGVHVVASFAFADGEARPLVEGDNRNAEEALFVVCRADKRDAVGGLVETVK